MSSNEYSNEYKSNDFFNFSKLAHIATFDHKEELKKK